MNHWRVSGCNGVTDGLRKKTRWTSGGSVLIAHRELALPKLLRVGQALLRSASAYPIVPCAFFSL